MVRLEAKKARIVMRVTEILEYLGSARHPVTVMDIARANGRPQSTTSEMLSSLLDMGFVYKDPITRAFSPTPRLASLGLSGQSAIVQDGRLFNYMDMLAKTTRMTVALFGTVGTHVQIFRWLPAPRALKKDVGIGCAELLSSCAVGQLLLSTMDPAKLKSLLWRLNAEAMANEKFDLADMASRIGQFRQQGHAIGNAGFIPGSHVSAVLLPAASEKPPLALGIICPEASARDADAYLATLKHGIGQIFFPEDNTASKFATPFMRAI